MIHISITDGAIAEAPFREISTTFSSKASFWRIVREVWELVWCHHKLRKGNTYMQREYADA